MTRLEAVIETNNTIQNEFNSDDFTKVSQENKALILEGAKLSTLVDISVTLATIADALNKEVLDVSNS